MTAGGPHEIVNATLVVRPNRSLPIAGTITMFAVLGVWTLLIGVAFTLAGAWMVLPFAAVETVFLAILCRWFYSHRDDCDLVMIETDRVQVVKRRGKMSSRNDFPRYWARVTVDRPSGLTARSRLLIGSHGRFVSIGDDINDSDRARLASQLKGLLRS